MMKILFFLFLTACLSSIFMLMAAKLTKKHRLIQSRAIKLQQRTTSDKPKAQKNDSRHSLNIGMVKIRPLIEPYIPNSYLDRIWKTLSESGHPLRLLPYHVVIIKVLLALSLFFLTMLLYFSGDNQSIRIISVSTLIGLIGWFYPDLYLFAKKKERRNRIQKQMPDFFDMFTLSIQAGMGTDAALLQVCKEIKGPLSEEFHLAIDSMKLGRSRKEAWLEMKGRIDIASMHNVLNAMIQANQLGIPMAKVLRAQTQRIRNERMHHARENAMKAPVKMLFPMILFIFPTLFIVLLGPIIVRAVTEWFH